MTQKTSKETLRGKYSPKASSATNKKGSSVTKGKMVIQAKTLNVGDVCEFKITALAPNNIGIDEVSYPYAVFVPNAQYGSKVKAKIVKINVQKTSAIKKHVHLSQDYAVAQFIEEVTPASSDLLKTIPVKPGEVLNVAITKVNSKGAGIVEVSPNFKVIVPSAQKANGSGQGHLSNEKSKILVTRVKEHYAFGKIQNLSASSVGSLMGTKSPVSDRSDSKQSFDVDSTGAQFLSKTRSSMATEANKLAFGSKFTTTLPLNAKQYHIGTNKFVSKFVTLKVNGSILFVKLGSGTTALQKASATSAKPGDKVRIKVTASSPNYAVGKILQVNPVSQAKKTTLVMNSIRDMLAHSMHFGEKAVKCHARMKNSIWLKKQGQNKNRPLLKKGRHIINLFKTRRCLNKALNMLTKYALKGRTFLFIGTKKPAAGLVARASYFTKNSFYVNTRWLGGMLTNWKTICKSISKIRPILKEKQKVVRDILERRQTIKTRLIKKALLLKKKSKLILTKGRQLLEIFKKNNVNQPNKNEIALRAQKLTTLRNELITKGMDYIQKRRELIQKQRELAYKTLLLKEKGLQISAKSKLLLNQLSIYNKKLREYKYLLILTSEIKALRAQASTTKKLYSVTKFTQNQSVSGIIPNPPKDILNRIALLIKNSDSANVSKVTSKAAETKQVLVCSTLLSKFSGFSSYIKTVIQSLISSIQSLAVQCKNSSIELNTVKKTLETYLVLKNQYATELQQLKAKLRSERAVIQIVKRKLKALDAQKKLLKFFPRLRYLPTPQTKISEMVQILLTKIVDPKLKYSIDNIYDPKLSTSSKKLAAARKKKWQRLEKYFGGIANMTKLTKAQISRNVAIIIGQKEEMNAVRECQKLGIKMFTIVDTNCNPALSDHVIPANDDSRNSIKYILTKFITRIRLAQKIRARILKIQKTK
uniref:Small ribosomal subunit protein uS2c n=1 Tax=Chlamydomonas applanata TaxID=35704 RepID=A0A0S2LPD2_CHLAP|nr:ribosomal protein S2 [Chlamydomonas applanata]